MTAKDAQRFSRRGFVASAVSASLLSRNCGAFRELSAAQDAPQANAARPQLTRYPLYRASGTHRQLGQQHGEQAKQHIHAHLDYMCATMRVSRAKLRERAARFQPLFQTHCPHLLEEIQGLAQGAGIPFADALAVNIRGALNATRDGGCTAFVVSGRGTADRQILSGQNSDMFPAMIPLAYVLHLQPQDKPEVLMWTFGGMIGYHGINSRGVGHFANDVGGGPQPRFGMPHYPVKRLMLETATVGAAERHLRDVPLWANGNYVVHDGSGAILDVEATTAGPQRVTDDGRGFIAHSNHFVCAKYATPANHRASAADSFSRLRRINQLIAAKFGRLGVSDFKTFLRDRAGDPNGICRFAQTSDPAADWTTAGITVASIIAEPARRQLHIAVGNRADTPFVVYRMHGS